MKNIILNIEDRIPDSEIYYPCNEEVIVDELSLILKENPFRCAMVEIPFNSNVEKIITPFLNKNWQAKIYKFNFDTFCIIGTRCETCKGFGCYNCKQQGFAKNVSGYNLVINSLKEKYFITYQEKELLSSIKNNAIILVQKMSDYEENYKIWSDTVGSPYFAHIKTSASAYKRMEELNNIINKSKQEIETFVIKNQNLIEKYHNGLDIISIDNKLNGLDQIEKSFIFIVKKILDIKSPYRFSDLESENLKHKLQDTNIKYNLLK